MTLSRFTIGCAIGLAAIFAARADALPIHEDDLNRQPWQQPIALFELESECRAGCAEHYEFGGLAAFRASLVPAPVFVPPGDRDIPTGVQGIEGSGLEGWGKVIAFCEANAAHEKCSKSLVPTTSTVVASVPEPGTFTLLVAGLLGLGLMAGRQRRQPPRAQQA